MNVKCSTAAACLARGLRWAVRLENPNTDDMHAATNWVVGCLIICAQSPTTDLRAWIARKPYRQALRQPSKAVGTKSGRKAIAELLRLAKSVIEAHWQDEINVGPLPVVEPTRPSTSHMAALRAGYQQWRQRQAKLRSAAQAKCRQDTLANVSTCLGTEDGEST